MVVYLFFVCMYLIAADESRSVEEGFENGKGFIERRGMMEKLEEFIRFAR